MSNDIDERDPSWDTTPSIVGAEFNLAIAVLVRAIKDVLRDDVHIKYQDVRSAWCFLFRDDDALAFWLQNAKIKATPADFRLLLWRKYGNQMNLKREHSTLIYPDRKPYAAAAKTVRELLSTGPATQEELAECADAPLEDIGYVLESLQILGRIEPAKYRYYRLAPNPPQP